LCYAAEAGKWRFTTNDRILLLCSDTIGELFACQFSSGVRFPSDQHGTVSFLFLSAGH
jgi:hypothetical protein